MKRHILRFAVISAFVFGASAVFAGSATQTYFFTQPRVEIINGQTIVVLDGAPTWGRVGNPLLPHGPVQLLLPPGEEAVTIAVETADPVILGDGYRISHRQKPIPLSSESKVEPTPPNPAVYSSDDPFPAERCGDLQTQFFCGHGIAYAAVYPVSYRPLSGQLSYYPWIRVTVKSQPTRKAQNAHDQMLKRNRSVTEKLSNMVQNPEIIAAYGPVTPSRTDGWNLLVITMADFVDDYQDFIDYKNRSGVLTTVETVEDIYAHYSGVDNQDKIRNCIIDYYQTYNISYVFLCGDNEHIPCRYLSSQEELLPADLYYAGLDGTWNDDGDDLWGEPNEADLVGEVAVGRSCADTPDEIAHVVNKSLMYQTEPVVDEVETALMVGEDLGWVVWGWEYKEEIRLGSSNWGYSTVGFPGNFAVGTLYDQPGYSWSAMGDLLPLLNQGPNLVNHLGHANEYYVMKFNSGSINDYNFTNDGINHNFFIGYSQGCYPGAFDCNYPDCILEAFTTIAHAAVAFVGNSRYGLGDYYSTNGPSQHFDRQFFDALFSENITTLGWMNQDSKEDNIWKVVGDNAIRYCYYELNLFGDPTLDVWTAEPGTFTPTHSSVALLGSSCFQVSNISVEGALVTISMDNEVLGQAEANASGQATVVFDELLLQLGDLDLMITAHDMLPYQATLPVIAPEGPYVIFFSCQIEDEITGNGNGQLDYAEAVELTLTAQNVGRQTANGVELTISSDDPLLTISDSTEYIGDIASGSTGTATSGFAFQISPEVEDGHEINFTLTASDGDSTWLSPFSITAYAPVVLYDRLVIDDFNGNYNNHLDPGESADFHVTLKNEGGSDAPDLAVVLSCDQPLIAIPEDSISLPLLAAGAETTIIYSGLTADSSIPQGDSVAFTLDISAQGGYNCTQGFSIVVGDVRYNPSGPDGYGYYAYDAYDGELAPEYDWIEIAPLAGGTGTDLELGDDEAVTVSLPFTFQFYGVSYSEATVCSHGWMTLGITTIFFPMNLPIPHIVPPNSTIAAFWDELSPASGGQVCTFDDAENHRFLVEWYQVPHEGSVNERETFQIVLYDPAQYPTSTGDGQIIVNYHTLSSLTDGCSLGIEDSAGAIGLQYLCDGEYDPLAMPLENAFAIKYTTGLVPAVEPTTGVTIPTEFSLDQNYPNPFNPATHLTFSLPKSANVSLVIYDIQGREVVRLVDGWRPAGVHDVTFDASNLASGIYLARIQVGNFTSTQKMVLVK